MTRTKMRTIIVTRARNGVFILMRPKGSQAEPAETQNYETWERLAESLRGLGINDAYVDGLRGQLKRNDIVISTL